MTFVVASAALLFLFSSHAGEKIAIDSIAVLPITGANSNSDSQVLGDGITSSLIDSLSQLPHLKVMSRSSVTQYKNKDVDPKIVGQQLSVKAVLTGQLIQQGDDLNLTVELVNASDDSHIWGRQYARKASEILPLQQELARNLSEQLSPTLSKDAKDKLAKQGTADPEAYQLYVKGQTYQDTLNADGWKKSAEFFEKAIARDPNYAAAYAGLAHSYAWLGFFGEIPAKEAVQKANEAANKAVQLDSSNAAAHSALGYAAMFAWDWSTSQRELRRALELNPSFPQAHFYYGQYLASQGNLEESVVEHKRALELDPVSQVYNQGLCAIYESAHQYDLSIQQCLKFAAAYPDVSMPHHELSADYKEQKNYAKAIDELQKEMQLNGNRELADIFGKAYAASGWTGVLRKEAELYQTAKYDDSAAVADAYANLGEKDKAFIWLNKAVDEHSPLFINSDTDFDSLHDDPRYAAILQRMGLPQ